jgi:hypothetical protein
VTNALAYFGLTMTSDKKSVMALTTELLKLEQGSALLEKVRPETEDSRKVKEELEESTGASLTKLFLRR